MTEQIQTPTKVFISYSWDSDEHKENVLKLANTLRAVWGIDAYIDRYVRAESPYTPVQGWDVWMSERIKWAEFVLIIFTETYQRRFEGNEEPEKGLGVSWEGTIIRNNLYNAQLRDTKFIPVVFSQSDLDYVPLVLNSRDKYVLNDDKSFRELCYRLRKQNTIIMPEIEGIPLLLPSEPVLFSPQKPPVKSLEQQQTPEIEYRKKVEEYVNRVSLSEPYDDIDEIHKTSLETINQKIGLDTDKAKAIEDDVLESRRQRHEIYKKNLQKYHNLLMKKLETEGFVSDDILSNLKELQNNLGLSDKDTEELLLYAQLEYSLEKESWIEADEITKNLLLKVTNVQQNYFSLTDFQKIPCKDIRKIDKLWTDYSKSHFGYSAQIDIWQQVKERAEVQDILFDFFVALDWGFYNEDHRFVYIDKFKYDLPNPPKGHRPVSVLWDGGSHETRQVYIKRIQKCCKDFVL
ncbi:GUN4 domain-containing protein [Nostoc sp. CHAB 5836]|uniref:GUN4 domain-containing protein n=1 Tax=Nostoc sp. CHAB 5836 TaxID=2780404 RepID=UPI001E63F0FB|nr:GUN4 domain-containing protein [Nostoc sp. CHAB 5836]MCC5616452.1 GUN4 domain-containing protein [Nostoc sp. CHAB 5836]